MKSTHVSEYRKILVLLGIRSSHNVGSLFRTADAVGIDELYLIGTTPNPIDRFGRQNPDISKTALGAEKTIPYHYYHTFEEAFERLRNGNFTIIGLEQSENSIDYKDYNANSDIALILGTEVTGIPKEILNRLDAVIEIPMQGEKESLNVSVAAGIALYRLFDK